MSEKNDPNPVPCVVCGCPSVVTAVESDRADKAYCAEHAPPDLKDFAEAIESNAAH
jgi:hypothetical protein